MNIGIDIDGVLFPWADVANEAVMARFGLPDPGPHLHWTHLKETIPHEAWSWLWSQEGADAIFAKYDRVYPGAVDMVNALTRNPGHRVHFVTHRDPRRNGLHTARFLREHFSAHPWAGLHVVQNAFPKHALMAWDVFVDDKPQTVYEMLDFTGAQVFTPARPWNRGLVDGPDCDDPRLTRYDDPWQIVEWVNAS